ncbi:endolytic transglycosylase MltG [Pseudobutyrivibrio sp. MD2005]|uniref:endolytic transglycosylase MltG n=1 Tax=Pseudobutyrivibrio sp. MD2005 TaxID=1410616 RepID=UPI0004844B57|nr:endolytic transglycosylase MltG [Pseudobutyrivibrio sp. MD2005]
MRLKYYLRGIGVGILFATLLLAISFHFGKDNLGKRDLTEQEIIARAEALGMVMPEDTEEDDTSEEETDASEEPTESQDESEDEAAESEVTGEVAEVLESDEAKEVEANDDSDETTVTYIPFSVHGGESSDTVAYHLYRAGLVDSSESFNKYMNSIKVDDRIQAGTFYIKEGSTYDDIVALLVNKDARTTTPPTE